MTSALSRRGFLGGTAAAGLGIAFAGSIDAIAGTAANAATRSASGYGPLVADPNGILSLPTTRSAAARSLRCPTWRV